MNEKSAEALLPPLINEHMRTIPNGIQQLTIKDSTVFIGGDHPHRSASPGCRRWSASTTIFVIIMVGFALVPTLYYLPKLISINGTFDSGYYVSLNRDMLNPLTKSMYNIERAIASFPDLFNKNQLETNSESNVTILYFSRDPAYTLNDFFEFNSVYIARAYQTTLSFLIENNQSSTYIDDVSVNSSYGSQLIINGGFESGTYGWQGLWSYTTCYKFGSSKCADSRQTSNKIISQTFSTTPRSVLYISFKLRWYGYGAGILTNVTIYP